MSPREVNDVPILLSNSGNGGTWYSLDRRAGSDSRQIVPQEERRRAKHPELE